jgi:hypothetical protein
MPSKTTKRNNNQYRRKRRGAKKTVGRYRPAYNLNSLQISNVRPTTMRMPIQTKQQFFVKNPTAAPFSTVFFFRLNAPSSIWQCSNPNAQLIADTTLNTNHASELNTLTGMYSKGIVLGAKCEWSLKFIDNRTDVSATLPDTLNNPNQQIQGVYTGVCRDNSFPTVNTQPSTLIEAHNFRESRVLAGSFHSQGASTTHTPYTGRGATKRLQGVIKYNPRKQLGIKDVQDCEDLYLSPIVSSQGNEQTYACIDVQQALDTVFSGSALVPDAHNSFYLDVKMTYMLQVSEPSIVKQDNLSGVAAHTTLGSAPVVPMGGGTFI